MNDDLPPHLLEMMAKDSEPVTEREVVRRKYPVKGTPKDHQYRALSESYMREGHCWWMDPGAGKTFCSIADAGLLYDHQKIDGVLIIAPNGPHEQWIEEQVPLWCGMKWWGVHNKQKPSLIKKFFEKPKRGIVFASINYDALRTKAGEAFVRDFKNICPNFMLVIDESQKIKNPKAQRTKETLKISLEARYRRLLSGTPVLRGLEDLWSQYEACEAGLGWPYEPIDVRGKNNTLHTYGYMGYRTHYCVLAPIPNNPRAKRIVGYRNEEELRERTRPYATRIMADEFMVGETPDFMTVRTPMSDSQKKQYRLMEEHLIALMDTGTITAQNALVQMGKLQQIAAGFLYPEEEGEAAHVIGENKVQATVDIIEQLTEPVIVWTHFKYLQMQLELAVAKMGKTVYLRSSVEDWKKDPEGVLIGNQTSGLGVGMNLQHAAANIYTTNSFSSEARWQSLKRTDRIGQTKQVRYWDLITPSTVEVSVMEALKRKEEISKANIDELREMLK